MLTIVAVFFILNLFVISPVLYIFLKKLFSGETLPYKKSLTLCVQLLSIGLFIESIILAVHWYAPDFAVLVSLLLNLALFVLSVAIVKSKLDTTIGKAIAIQILAGVFAVVITFTFRNYVCQAYKIPSGSNAPTLLIGDQILVNKYIYKFGQPEINDFVVFKFPKNEKVDYLKRIVATPGDIVEIRDKKLIINHQEIDEKFIINTDKRILSKEVSPRDNFGPITVPKESYFVLGDNRDNSFDSRFWGFVEKDKIKGRAEVIYFSYNPNERAIRKDRIRKIIE